MRFISKSSNLRIVLKPGLPASPLAGRDAVPGVYVKFQDGIAIVHDDELVEKMHRHPGFGSDFIAVDEKGEDPFRSTRSEIEPVHHIQEIKYGHVDKHYSSKKDVKLSPEMEKFVNDLANARIKEMLPSILEATIKKMSDNKAQTSEDVNEPVVETDSKEELTKTGDVKPEEKVTSDNTVNKKPTRGRPKAK